MATIALAPMRFSRNHQGAAEEFDRHAFVSGGVAVVGDLMVLTDNTMVVCGADPTVISAQAVAAYTEVVPGDAIRTMIWRKIRPADVFVGQCYHSTAALAVLADATLDGQTVYGVIKINNNWHIDLEEGSATRVQIIKRLDSATDIYPRVEFQFFTANLTYR